MGAKNSHRTHTRETLTLLTVGLPIPVSHPIPASGEVESMREVHSLAFASAGHHDS
jgi:hypothetical protein